MNEHELNGKQRERRSWRWWYETICYGSVVVAIFLGFIYLFGELFLGLILGW